MLKAKDFRFYGREALKGRWLKAGAVGLLAGILGGTIGANSPSFNFSNSTTGNNVGSGMTEIEGISNGVIPFEIPAAFTAILLGVLLVVLIYAIVMMFISGATTLGYAKYNLNLVDDKNPKVGDIFSQYNRLGTGFGMRFFTGLFVFLWSLLFVIPGIIASYSYYMTPYILCENPDMTAREAIRESKKLMKGNKWRLFCLEFSFIGWMLLELGVMMACIGMIVLPVMVSMGSTSYVRSGVTGLFVIAAILVMCVVGIISALFLSPYVTASTAVFYREISERRYSDPHVEGEAEEFVYEEPVTEE